MSEVMAKMYCANHPNTETSLRCNNCEKPICAKCAVLTPTGYRCRECVKGQQKVFETTVWADYPIAFVVVLALSFLGSLIAYRLGFFVILLAPVAGGVIAEITRLVTRRRRSKRLYLVTIVAAIVGCLPIGIQFVLRFSPYGLIWHGLYSALMITTFYTRLAGIRI